MTKTFAEWMKLREYGVEAGLPYGAQNTAPTSVQTQPQVNPNATAQPKMTNLAGVPQNIVQQLQKTGPKMQGILNQANKSIQTKQYNDLTAALQAAMQQQPQTGVM